MKPPLLALAGVLATTALAAPARAQDAAGDWIGGLEVTPGNRLPLLVHIKRDDAGGLSGTMDSPLQAAMGIPLAEVKVADGSLSFTVPAIAGSYKGQWIADGKVWRGEWSQAGQHWPLAFIVPPPPKPLPADWQMPPDADIAKLIADRNAGRSGQGIVVGLLGPEGQRFVAGGTGASAKVDRNTLFEIGSISKVFTALILADMVNRHEVSLDDPAEKYLPAGASHAAAERSPDHPARSLDAPLGPAAHGRGHGPGRRGRRSLHGLRRGQAARLPRPLPAHSRSWRAVGIFQPRRRAARLSARSGRAQRL